MATKSKPTRLSKAEQRVIIAKDALAQLRAEKYLATKGTYIGNDITSRIAEWEPLLENGDVEDNVCTNVEEPLQALLKKDKGPCTVCAKGALFLSAVRKFNKANVGNLIDEDFEVAEKIFGKQFDVIEVAFEKWDYTRGGSYNGIPVPKAEAFGWQYDGDHDRLVAILKNIIKNNGTFKP